MKKQLLLITFVCITWMAGAQTIEKKKYNRNKESEDEVGYTQAVKVGNTIYISGVAARGDDMAVAIKKVYDALGKSLEAYGATYQNVVKENVYATDLPRFIENKGVRKEYFKDDYPAATWVGVKELYLKDFILEVELIAVVPDKR